MVGVWMDPVTAQVIMTLRAGMGVSSGFLELAWFGEPPCIHGAASCGCFV
jgi:hypothetical protein